MKKIYMISVLAALVLGMSSCRHKGFCEHHPHGSMYVEMEYDDDNDPDDIAYLRDKVRASRVVVYHYPTEEMVFASDITRSVNELRLDIDTYHFTGYNAGTEHITFSDMKQFSVHGATTRECDILEPLYGTRAVQSNIDLGNGEKVVIPCEPLWSTGITARSCNVGDTVRLKALPLHCRYTYEMRNVEGLNGVAKMSSFITGMSGGAILGFPELHTTPVTVAVPASVGDDGKTVVGEFFTFGHNALIKSGHRMGLFIVMQSGEKYMLLEGDHFDVTHQVVNAPNRRRVHIIIYGVKLPPSGTGTGFEVNLNPWGNGENIDIDFEF